jgi:hypothetical protein
MARLFELCLATLALMVAAASAAPMPCGGNTGIIPPHCVPACEEIEYSNGCGETYIEHDVIIDHDTDFYDEIIDDDCFEFDDDEFFDEDEFEVDCDEGEDYFDGGNFDNEDTDFGEDIDCHPVHGCGHF